MKLFIVLHDRVLIGVYYTEQRAQEAKRAYSSNFGASCDDMRIEKRILDDCSWNWEKPI